MHSRSNVVHGVAEGASIEQLHRLLYIVDEYEISDSDADFLLEWLDGSSQVSFHAPDVMIRAFENCYIIRSPNNHNRP